MALLDNPARQNAPNRIRKFRRFATSAKYDAKKLLITHRMDVDFDSPADRPSSPSSRNTDVSGIKGDVSEVLSGLSFPTVSELRARGSNTISGNESAINPNPAQNGSHIFFCMNTAANEGAKSEIT